MSSRLAAALIAALALLVSMPFVGHWERDRNALVQNTRMKAVYSTATAQGLDSSLLDLYRLDSAFDCLLYHAPGRPEQVSDYELCFDPQGRLVQTIDRHTGGTAIASLQEQPSLASVRLPVSKLMAIFASRGILRDQRIAGVSPNATSLPTVPYDRGALVFPAAKTKSP